MSYAPEIKAIFDLTLDLLEKDEQFDRQLLDTIRDLYDTGKLADDEAITNALGQIETSEETSSE